MYLLFVRFSLICHHFRNILYAMQRIVSNSCCCGKSLIRLNHIIQSGFRPIATSSLILGESHKHLYHFHNSLFYSEKKYVALTSRFFMTFRFFSTNSKPTDYIKDLSTDDLLAIFANTKKNRMDVCKAGERLIEENIRLSEQVDYL